MLARLAVVAVLTLVVAVLTLRYRRWRAGMVTDAPDHPRFPDRVVAGAPRTWVVFTTPFCASCTPVVERLRAADPTAAVRTVDATVEVGLTEAFSVRTAPTVFLARPDGEVVERLVGAPAVYASVAGRTGGGPDPDPAAAAP